MKHELQNMISHSIGFSKRLHCKLFCHQQSQKLLSLLKQQILLPEVISIIMKSQLKIFYYMEPI